VASAIRLRSSLGGVFTQNRQWSMKVPGRSSRWKTLSLLYSLREYARAQYRGSAVTASYPGYSCHSLRVIGVTAGDTARQAFFFLEEQAAGFSCTRP
jgi:hypothetical protein